MNCTIYIYIYLDQNPASELLALESFKVVPDQRYSQPWTSLHELSRLLGSLASMKTNLGLSEKNTGLIPEYSGHPVYVRLC